MDKVIILDAEKLSRFFQTVSRGFQRSPVEIIIAVVAVAAFVGVLLLAYLLQGGRTKSRSRRLARRRYAERAERLGLSREEQRLLDRLARCLKDQNRKHELLSNQPLFNHCVARLREREPEAQRARTHAALLALRLRLGFRLQGPEEIPASSVELPEGQRLALIRSLPTAGRARGRVGGQEPGCLLVELEPGSPAFAPGDAVRVYLQNRAGLFSFDSSVQSAGPDGLRLGHTDAIQRLQRRKYYRRKLSLPVSVGRPGTGEPPRPSLFADLGGNGASLRNPQGAFRPGEQVELIFSVGGERLRLTAEVLRLSKQGELMHVRFASMRESTRDRILGSLLKRAAPRGVPDRKA
jgi:hypothetical protein